MYLFYFLWLKINKIVGFTGLPVCMSVAGTDVNHDVVFSFARGLPSLSMPSKEEEFHFCNKCGWTRAQGEPSEFPVPSTLPGARDGRASKTNVLFTCYGQGERIGGKGQSDQAVSLPGLNSQNVIACCSKSCGFQQREHKWRGHVFSSLLELG